MAGQAATADRAAAGRPDLPAWGTDSGLLSPAWAGTPVEAAVTDEAILRAMLDAEAALVRAQARLGTVPAGAAETITRVAGRLHIDPVDLARHARAAANPVVGLVGRLATAVASVDPVAAEYVHRGSTSQDILDTGLMLVTARALGTTLTAVDRIAAALAELTDRYRGTPMPGRTLTQHAVPTTFGLKTAGWLCGVLQARRRLRQYLRELPVQMGGAAGTLAGYLEHRPAAGNGHPAAVPPGRYAEQLLAAFADEAGLAQPVLPWHAVRTPIAELGAVTALLTGALGKIAVDVQSLARTEVAEVAEPAGPGRGVSSAMPQKRNPVLATLVRSAALQVPALASILAQSMLAEDERSAGVWHAEWQPARECLRLAGGAAYTTAELVEGLIPYADRMRANLDLTGSLIVAERMVAVLAPALGSRAARELMNRACTQAASERRSIGELLAGAPELDALFTREALDELLDPTGYLGAAEALAARMLDQYRAELAEPPGGTGPGGGTRPGSGFDPGDGTSPGSGAGPGDGTGPAGGPGPGGTGMAVRPGG